MRLRIAAVAAACGLAATGALAVADSFTPVRLAVRIARTAHVRQKLPITVTVSADKGVLDTRTAPLRVQVKLASECGGTFRYTPGVVLVNKRLRPQPVTDRAYRATVRGYGRPRARGVQTVCVWLNEEGDGRTFASDQSRTVDVKGPARRRARAAAAVPPSPPPPIKHVFIIVLENESEATTFGPGSPAPYLAKTLRSQGAFLPNYYGTGHESNDNYISMISGQPPNPMNQADCQFFDDFAVQATGNYGAEEGAGCVYPADIQTIAGQLSAAGRTWRDYNQSMGNDPSREAAECGHPAIGAKDGTQSETATDAYATRHDPFVYFHSIIDDTTLCDTHVVNLDLLPHDLASAAATPNYVFITPDLCSDGHDATCADPSRPGGFAGIEQFLEQWVPQITHSPAFTQQNGLLIITFDEASGSDASSCCGEIAGPASPSPGASGPGGGDVGAVLLSPCIAPGTVTQQAYNHYTMLRSVEDQFGLAHLGYAQLPGERDFGSDVFTRRCNAPPVVRVRAPRVSGRRFAVSWSSRTPGATFQVQERRSRPGRPSAWRTLLHASSKRRLVYSGRKGQTLQFRVRGTSGIGVTGSWRTVTVRVR